ncbi:hypothetical protein MLD38_025165 [Melastoma candidum]|uniref:Uncharacterized protein n=1 Tax=Melastoma candidum TaxID=119954 RepID=A0ACB9NUH9_9MYRT|nr:hypothetical protein MLD38_025165 [Melastoma candidum]
MAQRPHVPQFGKWDSAQNAAYTVYFDQARKGRTGGRVINPNDPEENPDLLPRDAAAPEVRAPSPQAPRRERPIQPVRDDAGGMNRYNEARGHRVPARGLGGSAGSENSIERSPMHPRAKAPARVGGGVGVGLESPSWEEQKKGRTRGGQTTPERTAGTGAAVPRFGEWDVKNPSAGEGYTDIFNKVRAEKERGPSDTPGRDANHNNNGRSHQSGYARRPANDSQKVGCFSWCC